MRPLGMFAPLCHRVHRTDEDLCGGPRARHGCGLDAATPASDLHGRLRATNGGRIALLAGQERTSSPVLARRRRRAQAWLASTTALHVPMLALTVVMLPLGHIEQAPASRTSGRGGRWRRHSRKPSRWGSRRTPCWMRARWRHRCGSWPSSPSRWSQRWPPSWPVGRCCGRCRLRLGALQRHGLPVEPVQQRVHLLAHRGVAVLQLRPPVL